MVEKSSKSIEKRCSHCAIRLVLLGKPAPRNGNIKHKEVNPQSNEPFRCIDIYSLKAITRLLSLCGYTP